MRKKIALFYLVFAFVCFGADAYEESAIEMLIAQKKYLQAKIEIEQGLLKAPQSEHFISKYIELLVKVGNPREAASFFQENQKLLSHETRRLWLLDKISWGLIQQCWDSHQQRTRMCALFLAAWTARAEALPLLREGLSANQSLIRIQSCELISNFGYSELSPLMYSQLEIEKNTAVRNALIRGVAKVQQPYDLEKLKARIREFMQERAEMEAVISSLTYIFDSIPQEEWVHLIHALHPFLREMACELVRKQYISTNIESLYSLLRDPSISVQSAACCAIGLFGFQFKNDPKWEKELLHLSEHPNIELALVATWALCQLQSDAAKDLLEKWIISPNSKIQYIGSWCIGLAGEKYLDIAKKYLKIHSDPYVRANIALSLIGQGYEKALMQEISEELFSFFNQSEELWYWNVEGQYLFHPLQKLYDLPSASISFLMHLCTPEQINQISRFNFLIRFSSLEYPQFNNLMQQFLESAKPEVMGMVAQFFLFKGGELAVDTLRKFLHHKDEKIAIRAAIALARWNREEDAITILEKGYEKADKDTKIAIVEAIGEIASERSITFLSAQLSCPFPILRAFIAAALIRCLDA